MKTIWLASTVIIMTAAATVKAQTDTTYRRSDSTFNRFDTTYKRSDSSLTNRDSSGSSLGTSDARMSSSETVQNTTYSTKSADRTGVRVGIRAGVNSSNIKKSENSEIDLTSGAKLGLNAALFVEIPIIPALSIQPEVQFSQKGFKASGKYLTTPYEYNLTSNFIDVPLLLKFKPSRGFGIIVGPQFSFLASTKTKTTIANATYENLVRADNDNLRKNILGGVIGLEAAAGPLLFDLRYSLDFQNNNGDGSSTTPNFKNQVIGLSVGIRL